MTLYIWACDTKALGNTHEKEIKIDAREKIPSINSCWGEKWDDHLTPLLTVNFDYAPMHVDTIGDILFQLLKGSRTLHKNKLQNEGLNHWKVDRKSVLNPLFWLEMGSRKLTLKIGKT